MQLYGGHSFLPRFGKGNSPLKCAAANPGCLDTINVPIALRLALRFDPDRSIPVGVLRTPVGGKAPARSRDEDFDPVGQVNLGDRPVAPNNAQKMRLIEHIDMGKTSRWLELIAGELDKQSQRILEIDRIEYHAIAHARVLDAPRIESLDRLHEHGARNVEGDVMDTTDIRRGAPRNRRAILACEDGYETAVAGIEVKMALE